LIVPYLVPEHRIGNHGRHQEPREVSEAVAESCTDDQDPKRIRNTIDPEKMDIKAIRNILFKNKIPTRHDTKGAVQDKIPAETRLRKLILKLLPTREIAPGAFFKSLIG